MSEPTPEQEERRAEFRARFNERLREKLRTKAERKRAEGYIEPRHDEVFARGTAWLNTL